RMEREYGEFQRDRTERLKQADARGEKVLEIEVPITIRIPEGDLFYDPETALDNTVFLAKADLYTKVIEEINKARPEMVAASKKYNENRRRVYDMFTP